MGDGDAPSDDGVRYLPRVEPDRAYGVVVAGDDIVDAIGVVVAVNHAHNGYLELPRLADGDILVAHIQHKQGVRPTVHVLDAGQIPLQFFQFPLHVQRFLLAHLLHAASGLLLFQFLQTLDGLLDRLVIRQQAPQPAQVDIRHLATLGLLLDDLLGRLLGADEQHRAALGRQLADEVQGLLKQRQGLLQVDDVNFVAVAKQVIRHLGIPIAGLVAEMDAGFQHLFHAEVRHGCLRSSSGLSLRAPRIPPGRQAARTPICAGRRACVIVVAGPTAPRTRAVAGPDLP